MTDISFYHLIKRSLESVLPKLLEKTLEVGGRAVIFASSEERVKEIDDLLWTYDPKSWLPHSASKDGFTAEQPVWITCENDNANDAAYLFLIDGIRLEQINGYKRIFDLFDGHDESAVIDARTRWTFYKEKGVQPTYWQEDENGKWAKAQ